VTTASRPSPDANGRLDLDRAFAATAVLVLPELLSSTSSTVRGFGPTDLSDAQFSWRRFRKLRKLAKPELLRFPISYAGVDLVLYAFATKSSLDGDSRGAIANNTEEIETRNLGIRAVEHRLGVPLQEHAQIPGMRNIAPRGITLEVVLRAAKPVAGGDRQRGFLPLAACRQCERRGTQEQRQPPRYRHEP
jgi:hypothetical protein